MSESSGPSVDDIMNTESVADIAPAPDAVEEVSEPEVAEAEAEPEVAEPEVAEPEPAEVAEPEVAEVAEPEVTEVAEVAEPEVTEVAEDQPEVAEPEVTEVAEDQPEVTEPEVTEVAEAVEQVANDIRNILAPVGSGEVSENVCSLKTLVNVLVKWSGNQIKKRNVETLLKEGKEIDENLDDLEKVVEIIQLWVEQESEFKTNNYFLQLDEYTLVEESRNLDSEKKHQLLGKLVQFLIDCSQGKYNNTQINIFLNNFY